MVTNFMSIEPFLVRLENKWKAERLRKLLLADEFCRGIEL